MDDGEQERWRRIRRFRHACNPLLPSSVPAASSSAATPRVDAAAVASDGITAQQWRALDDMVHRCHRHDTDDACILFTTTSSPSSNTTATTTATARTTKVTSPPLSASTRRAKTETKTKTTTKVVVSPAPRASTQRNSEWKHARYVSSLPSSSSSSSPSSSPAWSQRMAAHHQRQQTAYQWWPQSHRVRTMAIPHDWHGNNGIEDGDRDECTGGINWLHEMNRTTWLHTPSPSPLGLLRRPPGAATATSTATARARAKAATIVMKKKDDTKDNKDDVFVYTIAHRLSCALGITMHELEARARRVRLRNRDQIMKEEAATTTTSSKAKKKKKGSNTNPLAAAMANIAANPTNIIPYILQYRVHRSTEITGTPGVLFIHYVAPHRERDSAGDYIDDNDLFSYDYVMLWSPYGDSSDGGTDGLGTVIWNESWSVNCMVNSFEFVAGSDQQLFTTQWYEGMGHYDYALYRTIDAQPVLLFRSLPPRDSELDRLERWKPERIHVSCDGSVLNVSSAADARDGSRFAMRDLLADDDTLYSSSLSSSAAKPLRSIKATKAKTKRAPALVILPPWSYDGRGHMAPPDPDPDHDQDQDDDNDDDDDEWNNDNDRKSAASMDADENHRMVTALAITPRPIPRVRNVRTITGHSISLSPSSMVPLTNIILNTNTNATTSSSRGSGGDGDGDSVSHDYWIDFDPHMHVGMITLYRYTRTMAAAPDDDDDHQMDIVLSWFSVLVHVHPLRSSSSPSSSCGVRDAYVVTRAALDGDNIIYRLSDLVTVTDRDTDSIPSTVAPVYTFNGVRTEPNLKQPSLPFAFINDHTIAVIGTDAHEVQIHQFHTDGSNATARGHGHGHVITVGSDRTIHHIKSLPVSYQWRYRLMVSLATVLHGHHHHAHAHDVFGVFDLMMLIIEYCLSSTPYHDDDDHHDDGMMTLPVITMEPPPSSSSASSSSSSR